MTTLRIKDYEHYIIFEDGVIINSKSGVKIDGWVNENNYNRVGLCSQNKYKNFYLHLLLGWTFIPNPLNLPELDHRDRDRSNNSLSNLRWVDKATQNGNRGMPSTNTSGEMGISLLKNGKYKYSKTINKISHSKTFDTKIEAIIYKKEYLESLNMEYI
tara:strand:+ start:1302 stop:1775 length:474 start_codon:yes stop_codon:yes gene_type:complete